MQQIKLDLAHMAHEHGNKERERKEREIRARERRARLLSCVLKQCNCVYCSFASNHFNYFIKIVGDRNERLYCILRLHGIYPKP